MSPDARISRSDADRRAEDAFRRHKQGDLRSAYQCYREVLSLYPDHAAALHYLGLLAQQTGHSRDAVQLLQRSLSSNPADARTYNHLGQVYVTLNDRSTAAACFEKSLEIDPRHADALNNLANVLKVRDLARAIELYRRAIEIDPRAVHALYNLGQALKEDNAHEEAIRMLERALAVDSRHVPAHHNLGVLFEQRGSFERAIEHYHAARRLDPAHVGSLANLIAIGSYQPGEAEVSEAHALLAHAAATAQDCIKLHHGLGKHYDRIGEFDRAFRHFTASKHIVKQRAAEFDGGLITRTVDHLIRAFSAEVFAATRSDEPQHDRLVFIVGMPRSGTTLTEQILASHPQVFGAGELQDIPRIVKSLRPSYPDNVACLGSAALHSLAQSYLRVIERTAPPQARRVIDKLPANFLHLGMIALLFPGARVIHCRRNPLDVGLSCFIELFQMERDYTTDLEDFARYYLEYERLMAHWRAVLPLTMHEQRYEDLVAHPESGSRALVAHCALDWHPACLEFQNTERAVRTPSRWQVRQPMYRSSVERWRRYESHMAPLQRLLAQSRYTYAS